MDCRIFYKYILFVLLIFSVRLSAADRLPQPAPAERAPLDPLFHVPLTRGIELVFADRYEQSLALFDSLQAAHPGHPGPPFYKAAVYQTWMSAYRFNGFQEELEVNVQAAVENAERLLQQGDDPWFYFYSAGAYGYRAYFKFRQYNWFGAYKDSRKSLKQLNQGLTLEPRLYDAYLGLGAYHYWSTAKSMVLRLLTFLMPDRREQGLQEIELAMRHGRYTRDEARLVLVTALYDYRRYDRALALLEQGARPLERQIMSELYLRGRLLGKTNRWAEAEAVFRELLQRLDDHVYASIGYKVESRFRLAQSLEAQGDLEAALGLAAEAVLLLKKRDPDTELESDIVSFEEVSGGLKKLYADLQRRVGSATQQH